MLLAFALACSFPVLVPVTGPSEAPDLSLERGSSYGPPTAEPAWTVDCEGGGDFTTIADAVEIAADGDWISVAPCTYEEGIDFEGKSLWISSVGGSAETVLEPGRGNAVTATYGTGDGTAVVGFTIRDSRDAGVSPVYAEQSALLLQDVVFEDAVGTYAIIYGYASDLELRQVTIDDSNRLGSYGAVAISRGALIADELSVDCRAQSYATWLGHGSFFIDHSDLDCSPGFAVSVEHSIGRVHRSTLTGDVEIVSEDDHYTDAVIFENDHFRGDISVTYGALVIRNSFLDESVVYLNQVYNLDLESSVIAHTRCPISIAFTADTSDTGAPDPDMSIEHNDFFDNDSENCDGVTTYTGSDGNISADPRFVDEEGGDYRTDDDSPLVDAGLPEDEFNDPDGTTNDIGLYGGPRSIGGGW